MSSIPRGVFSSRVAILASIFASFEVSLVESSAASALGTTDASAMINELERSSSSSGDEGKHRVDSPAVPVAEDVHSPESSSASGSDQGSSTGSSESLPLDSTPVGSPLETFGSGISGRLPVEAFPASQGVSLLELGSVALESSGSASVALESSGSASKPESQTGSVVQKANGFSAPTPELESHSAAVSQVPRLSGSVSVELPEMHTEGARQLAFEGSGSPALPALANSSIAQVKSEGGGMSALPQAFVAGNVALEASRRASEPETISSAQAKDWIEMAGLQSEQKVPEIPAVETGMSQTALPQEFVAGSVALEASKPASEPGTISSAPAKDWVEMAGLPSEQKVPEMPVVETGMSQVSMEKRELASIGSPSVAKIALEAVVSTAPGNQDLGLQSGAMTHSNNNIMRSRSQSPGKMSSLESANSGIVQQLPDVSPDVVAIEVSDSELQGFGSGSGPGLLPLDAPIEFNSHVHQAQWLVLLILVFLFACGMERHRRQRQPKAVDRNDPLNYLYAARRLEQQRHQGHYSRPIEQWA